MCICSDSWPYTSLSINCMTPNCCNRLYFTHLKQVDVIYIAKWTVHDSICCILFDPRFTPSQKFLHLHKRLFVCSPDADDVFEYKKGSHYSIVSLVNFNNNKYIGRCCFFVVFFLSLFFSAYT